jgi:hypothetical protein
MKSWFILLVIFLFGIVFPLKAQELLLTPQKGEALRIFPSGEVFRDEIWMVNLKEGENLLKWQRPENVSPEEVNISLEGATLKEVVHQMNNQESVLYLEALQGGLGKISFCYPWKTLVVEPRYQITWERGTALPEVVLLVSLEEKSLSPHRGTTVQFLGREFSLDLGPGETKTILVASFNPLAAQEFLEHRSGEGGKLFWEILLPPEFLLKAKVEYFAKDGPNVTFLGEGYFSPETPAVKLPLGEARDLLVQETMVLREKRDRFYNNLQEEVLYDTREEKRYHLENLGKEEKRVVVFQQVQPSFRVLETTIPIKREDLNLISFSLILKPQTGTDILLRVEGQKLTSGWVLGE